jgi:hypothetical protein
MHSSFLRKNAQPVTVSLVREKFLESIKLSIERGWDSYPVTGKCPEKSAGRSNSFANEPLSFRH